MINSRDSGGGYYFVMENNLWRLLIFFTAFEILSPSIAEAQTINYYELLAVADAAALACARKNPSETERYRHSIYVAYLGRYNADSFIEDEAAARAVLERDPIGVAEYRVVFEEAEHLLLGLTEADLQKKCTLFTNTDNDLPGFLQQPKN